MRIIYRVRQFWHAVRSVPAAEDLILVRRALPPALMALFMRMQASEQSHSLWVYRQLCEQNETNEDLLVAALLHDVGKSRYPMQTWERVLIVLGNAFFPQRVKSWGQAHPGGWKRAFAVAEGHAAWGAEMAEQAGASPMAVALIRRHQDPVDRSIADRVPIDQNRLVQSSWITTTNEAASPGNAELEDQLLHRLKMLDEEN